MCLIVAATMAFAGPTERFLYEKNYTKAVYDILVTHEVIIDGVTQVKISYGQGLAIGPHYILTAQHVVGTEDMVTFLYPQPAVDTIVAINIVGHSTISTDSIRTSVYKYYKAEIVEIGKGNFEDDWAILRVSDILEDYVVVSLWTDMHPGEDVWNLSGNQMPISYPFKYTIVGTELESYDAIYEFGMLTLFEAPPFDVYVATPIAVQGDSGSPVFDKYGNLIGVLVAGGKKISLICKAEKFAEAFERYKGK